MRPKLVIFDLDGTLLDTIGDVAACFNRALVECGFPGHPAEAYPSLVGGDLEQIVPRLLPAGASAADAGCVKAAYRRAYAAFDKPLTRPFPGVEAALVRLASAGVPMAVNTNKGQDLAEQCVARYFPGLDLPVAGYREGRPSKPDPSGALGLAERFGAEPAACLYVGDGETDALTARNAGMPFVWAAWGQSGLSSEAKAVVAATAVDASQLMRVLKRIA